MRPHGPSLCEKPQYMGAVSLTYRTVLGNQEAE